MLFIIHLPRHVLGSSFVGFQGDPWISAHIDVLRPTMHNTITLHETMGMSISDLFYGKLTADKEGREEEVGELYQDDAMEVMQVQGNPPSFQGGFNQDKEMQVEEERRSRSPQLEQPEMDTSVEGETPYKKAKADAPESTPDFAEMLERQLLPKVPNGVESEELVLHTPPPVQKKDDSLPHLHTQFRRLHGCIQPAASRLQDSLTNKERTTKRVAILVSLIPRNPSFPLGMQGLCVILISAE